MRYYNYQADETRGKNCHFARVMVENMMTSASIQKLLAFRKGCAAAGIGRNLIVYCGL